MAEVAADSRPSMNVPFARVDCSGKELDYVREVLESGWLTTASKAQALEAGFREMVGCAHAITVNSCTSALHLALDACGIGEGDEVLLPTLTFTATAEVVRYMSADPVLLDVEPRTGCLDRDVVAAAIEAHPKARAVIVVHYGGYPIRMDGPDGLATLCREKGVALVSDAAHALPARRDGRYIGASGDITCLSFYANKTMTTGEGGMLLTDDDELARRARLMRLHGIDRDVWNRFTDNRNSWEYDVLAPGFKYNMPDLNAAVGLAQFERLESMRALRQECAAYYTSELGRLAEIDLFEPDVPPEDHAWHLFPIMLTDAAAVPRDEAIARLSEMGIGTSVHYKPIHRLTYYQDRYGLTPEAYPVADRIWKSCISLPIYNLLTRAEQQYVMQCVKEVVCR